MWCDVILASFGDKIPQIGNEAVFHFSFHQSAVLGDENHLKLVIVLSVDMDYSLLKGSLLILSHEESMHGHFGNVHKIDSFSITTDKEWESSRVVIWQRNQICALKFVTQRAFNFNESTFKLVYNTNPRDSPASYSELVW